MKNIQNYLILTLSIVLSASFHALAMEPIGEASASSELGGELEVSAQHQHILRARTQRLNSIFDNLNKQKKNPHLNEQQYIYIKKLQKNIRETLEIIQNMYFGIIPVNMNDINQKMEKIEQAIPSFY